MDELNKNNAGSNGEIYNSGFESYYRRPSSGERPSDSLQGRPVQRPAAKQDFKVNIPGSASNPYPAQQQRQQQRQQPASARRAAPSSGARKRAPAASKKSAARRKRRKKSGGDRLLKGSIIALVSLIVVVGLSALLSSVALATVGDILAIGVDKSTDVSIVIPEDATDFESVYEILCENDMIEQKFLCKLFLKFRHFDKYYSSSKGEYVNVEYEPGVYYLEKGSGVEVMLNTIKSSQSTDKETVRLTFPEGWTVAQIFEKIEKYNVCTAEKLYANLEIVAKQYDFYENIASNTGRYLKAEGYLYPDTYDFFIGESASSVLKKLFSNFDKKWTSEMNDKAERLGYSMDEIVIIASIIQREAKDASQMKDISSVIHNRLDDPSTYPLLEMNSTRDYITSTKEYGVFDDSYYSIYLDAYNTYSAQGLPPGAICSPGAAAIEAALEPNDTDYYFFCHDSEGTIYLAKTASEHLANTQRLLLY